MKKATSGPTKAILAGIFGLNKEDAAGIASKLLLLSSVCDEAERAARNIQEISEDLRGRTFPQIRSAIETMILSLHGSWDNSRAALARIDYKALEDCSELISRYQSEKEIEASELNDLQDEVDKLIAQVADSLNCK